MKKHSSEEVETLKKQVEEWKEKYLRALADYHNLEKRKTAETMEVRRYAGEILLIKLLPVIDTFEQAQAHLNDAGLAISLKKVASFLDEQGVKKIEVVGRAFNPHEMECIEVADGEDNQVMEEVLPGYTFRGKLIRAAKVKVGKNQTDKKAEELIQEEPLKRNYT